MHIDPQELIVREHHRFRCALEAYVRPDPGAVVLSTAAPDAGAGGEAIRVRVVDFSAGGAGLETHVFLPRACRLTLLAPIPQTPTGTPASADALDLPARVQRATMINREPRYYLGVAFLDLTPEQRSGLAMLLEWMRVASQESGAATGGAGVSRA